MGMKTKSVKKKSFDKDVSQVQRRRENLSTEEGKQDRRKQIDPTTCERDYDAEEVQFMKAMDEYKRQSGRQFPTWSEVLEVLHAIGYRKVAEPTEINYEKRIDF